MIKEFERYCAAKIKTYPQLKYEINETYGLTLVEIDEGALEEHEISLSKDYIESLIL